MGMINKSGIVGLFKHILNNSIGLKSIYVSFWMAGSNTHFKGQGSQVNLGIAIVAFKPWIHTTLALHIFPLRRKLTLVYSIGLHRQFLSHRFYSVFNLIQTFFDHKNWFAEMQHTTMIYETATST